MSLRTNLILSLFLGLTPSQPARAADGDAPVSFRNDVMAVFAKSGCNAGACHGNKNGKGGLKLSLRGQDPDLDYATLTRDLFARRTNPLDPDHSLILLKATARIPHEGGVRFRTDSPDYALVRRWIEAGTPWGSDETPTVVRLDVTPSEQVLIEPADRTQLHATAVFSDGSSRDVTSLAVYEQSSDLAKITPDGLAVRQRLGETTVIVRYLAAQQPVRLAFVPARPDFQWHDTPAANYIDEQVFSKLRTMRITPSKPCTDTEFLRRAYLDLLGLLPTADEARASVADTSPDKRARLIDHLLDRPEYADHWTLKWSDLLKNEERTLDRKGVQNFHRWIRQSVATNKPLDQFAREILSARGSTYAQPAANYYRANRDPVTRGEATAQLFLGIRLQCAQCHNHPFDRWTQDDYYGWADVFARVNYKILENRRTDENDKHEFVGEQIVYESRDGDVKDPRGADRAVKPRLLGTSKPLADDTSRLDALAAWVTSPGNPYFAKAQVNRIWFHLMGRGIVDPIDDFRPTNPPSHPQLLDALAKDFVDHHYDVKHLIRTIMNSRTYALASEPNPTNAADETNYSHALPRRLTAEQLLDAQHQVTGVPTEFAGYPRGMRAGEMPGVRIARSRGSRPTQADMFLVTFGKPARQLVCECERSTDATLGQTFQLISGPEIAKMLSAPDNRLAQLLDSNRPADQLVDDLYWSALSRPPTEDERNIMTAHVRSAPSARKGLEDVTWALLNSKEFVLRR
jgi:mono/diheme cytochrome c family protein